MLSETLSRRSFLGLEGQHVFIAGTASAIGGEAVREFLGRSGAVVFHVCVACTQDLDYLSKFSSVLSCRKMPAAYSSLGQMMSLHVRHEMTLCRYTRRKTVDC